jgi:hypothetical protein
MPGVLNLLIPITLSLGYSVTDGSRCRYRLDARVRIDYRSHWVTDGKVGIGFRGHRVADANLTIGGIGSVSASKSAKIIGYIGCFQPIPIPVPIPRSKSGTDNGTDSMPGFGSTTDPKVGIG